MIRLRRTAFQDSLSQELPSINLGNPPRLAKPPLNWTRPGLSMPIFASFAGLPVPFLVMERRMREAAVCKLDEEARKPVAQVSWFGHEKGW
jgi:hypothetical protein